MTKFAVSDFDKAVAKHQLGRFTGWTSTQLANLANSTDDAGLVWLQTQASFFNGIWIARAGQAYVNDKINNLSGQMQGDWTSKYPSIGVLQAELKVDPKTFLYKPIDLGAFSPPVPPLA